MCLLVVIVQKLNIAWNKAKTMRVQKKGASGKRDSSILQDITFPSPPLPVVPDRHVAKLTLSHYFYCSLPAPLNSTSLTQWPSFLTATASASYPGGF